ncbi:TonB-dependent receptor domain-containing protein [Tamilnaduibacter salinus]|uniref:TonB-dependent receptor domain-containing protein n=1 Tax=Tamilnaduibacter salinus TaxID=1484056 RepID=UPI0013045087|nr:TonB-dependent receptor [Tamilnaduibacter salinus]
MTTPTRLSLAIAIGLAPLTAPAAEELNPIVVTAGHTAQTVNEANASVTVISRSDIEKSAFTTVEDVLRTVPGLTIGNNGGVGQQSSVFLRGSNSDHVLVLVDGMRVGGAFFGTTQFQDLPLSLVERIEVVRGPRSSLYGAEAIGGVIQIFTRRGGQQEQGTSVMRAGNNGAAELVQHLSGGNENTRYNLSASVFDTEGQDAYIADNMEPDEDGFTSKSLAASVSHDVTERWRIGGNLLRAQGTNEFDDTFTPAYTYRDFVQQSGRVYSDYQATSRLNLHAQFGFGRESRDVQDSFPRNLETKRRQLKVRGDYAIGDHQMVSFGAERIDTEIEASATDYTTTERYNNAVFGQWQTINSPLDLQASVRHDDNEAYGEQTTGSVSAGYRVNRYLKPYVSVGTGFRAPNFNDLYSPFGANPDIQPETRRRPRLV